MSQAIIALTFQLLVFAASNFVDCLGCQLHHVESIMDNLVFCQWNRLLGRFDVSGTHVHRDRFDGRDLIL